MYASLLLLASFVLPPALPASTIANDDPPVRVWFNSGGDYVFGDRAKVYAKSARDGYLLVLRADGAGRVRVLFPLDPGYDQWIVGDRKYELKGRGGRESFIPDNANEHGIVLAAVSDSPFRMERFVRDAHWDTRTLTARLGDDPEIGLLALVRQMTSPGSRLEYAVATYVVSERYASDLYPDPYEMYGWSGYDPWWGPRYRLRFGLRY